MHPRSAWNKVVRWRKKYRLPVESLPNGKPFVEESVFKYWFALYRVRIAKYGYPGTLKKHDKAHIPSWP